MVKSTFCLLLCNTCTGRLGPWSGRMSFLDHTSILKNGVLKRIAGVAAIMSSSAIPPVPKMHLLKMANLLSGRSRKTLPAQTTLTVIAKVSAPCPIPQPVCAASIKATGLTAGLKSMQDFRLVRVPDRPSGCCLQTIGYGSWAASGEIDIMEAVNLKTRSDDPATSDTQENRIHGTLHYGRQWPATFIPARPTGYREISVRRTDFMNTLLNGRKVKYAGMWMMYIMPRKPRMAGTVSIRIQPDNGLPHLPPPPLTNASTCC